MQKTNTADDTLKIEHARNTLALTKLIARRCRLDGEHETAEKLHRAATGIRYALTANGRQAKLTTLLAIRNGIRRMAAELKSKGDKKAAEMINVIAAMVTNDIDQRPYWCEPPPCPTTPPPPHPNRSTAGPERQA